MSNNDINYKEAIYMAEPTVVAGLLQDNIGKSKNHPDRIRSIRELLREELNLMCGICPDKPIIASGHQVIFFHPGILSKETLAADLAGESGTAVTVVLDNDPGELFFSYPVFRPAPRRVLNQNMHEIRVEKLSLSLGRFFMDHNPINRTRGELWKKLISTMPGHFHDFLPENIISQLEGSFQAFMKLTEENPEMDLVDYVTHARLIDPSLQPHSVCPVRVSSLVKTRAWQNFCRLILEDQERFRAVYNESIEAYRREHHIKNHAQPVPNLSEGELPFWIYYPQNNTDTTGPTESPYGFSGSREKAYVNLWQPEKQNSPDAPALLPRAVTLSLFLRLFLSDLFIHGLGGQKYDQVTNRIMTRFFEAEPTGFLVKTQTLKLPVIPNSPLEQVQEMLSEKTWRLRYREFEYHGDNSLPVNHPLRAERKRLIEMFRAKKEKREESRDIHQKLEKNRLEIMEQLKETGETIVMESNEARRLRRDNRVLNDRTFPYFFYDWQNESNS